MSIVNGFDIDTVEGATAYLESEGVDVEEYVRRGIAELKRNKAFMSTQETSKNPQSKPDGYVLLGTVVSFPENKIHFYQDFRFWEGVPTGVEFTVKKEAGHNDYWLVADGYGNLDKPNCYGNGRIAVKEKDIRWALSQ